MGPEAFDYALPPAAIAQHPAARRGDARLLVVDAHAPDGSRREVAARELAAVLPPGALVVVNASKVVPARVFGVRSDGARFELLVCEPAPGQGPGTPVRAWVRGGRRLRAGDHLVIGADDLVVRATDRTDGRARWFEVEQGEVLVALHRAGHLPLPPYIERAPDDDDGRRYQTVFATHEGSIAAPTAGLHFEPEVLAALDVVRLTLHVGPGTFVPMDVADVRDHRVDPERVVLEPDAAARIDDARRHGRPIVAIGTTVVRALEGIAATQGGAIVPGAAAIDLVVTPGFAFGVVTHLVTNFHLPRSSLLMLVCAFAGRERILAAYDEAVARGFRFYSYGDCMLTSRAP